MSTEKIFLTARWENLVIISYKISPDLLQPHMPKGFEPDTIDGNAFVSVVAFVFADTKVKGIKVPFNVNFPEINLRFYVKNNEKRGVVFIREFVPKIFIPVIANTFYNENYRYIPMESKVSINGIIKLNHTIELNNKSYSITAEAENKPYTPATNSTEHFFKEHEWGFGITKKNETMIYKVEHPVWEVYPLIKFEHTFNFAEIYGHEWESLDSEKPYNIAFAKGSPVKVFHGHLL